MRTTHTAMWPWRAAIAAAAVAAFGALMWHAGTARLDAAGTTFVWVAAVGFGAAWAARGSAMWKSAASVVGGGAAGMATVYLSVSLLPLSPLGTAIGAASGLAVVLAFVAATRGIVRLGATLVAFGAGVAAAQAIGVGIRTGADELLAGSTAFALAGLGGVVAAELVAEVERWRRGKSGAEQQPASIAPAADEPVAVAASDPTLVLVPRESGPTPARRRRGRRRTAARRVARAAARRAS